MPADPVLRASREAIERGSRSFAAASRLLAPAVRDGSHLLYAWCRYCDDRIDGQRMGFAAAEPSASPAETLQHLRQGTSRALAGETVSEPAFGALQRVVARHGIPQAYPLSHLEGFAMDVRGTAYETVDDTIRYCYHVAGVVGVMMGYVLGVRDRATLDRAADLGIAFQLTNIARDVLDDAARGRVYLPGEWLRARGIDRIDAGRRDQRADLAHVVHGLLDEAERYYRSASEGIRCLPWRSAWAIATARLVYRDIGHRVRRRGARAWDERVIVASGWKLAWMGLAAADVTLRPSTAAGRLGAREGLWPIPRDAD